MKERKDKGQRNGALAKISTPDAADCYPRERLFALLDDAFERPAIWVSAPTGAGKTMLVASYAQDRHVDSFWYHVDEDDKDPAAFFDFLRSLGEQLSTSKSVLPIFYPEHLSSLAAFTRRFFRVFFERLPENACLVVDGCQKAANEFFHQILRDAVTQVPRDGMLVLVSTSQVPAELSRLLHTDRIATLGWNHVALDIDEARGLAAMHGLKAAEPIGELHRLSGGWMVGYLTLLKVASSANLSFQAITTETREALFDLFLTEVFDQLSEIARNVLLATAFFREFTPTMADSACANSEAGRVIQNLQKLNYFIQRRIGTDDMYQYHDLFRDFLIARVKRVQAAAKWQKQAVRCGDVQKEHGFLESAIGSYLTAEAWDRAAATIENLAPALIRRGRYLAISEWIANIDPGFLEKTPAMLYWAGVSQLPLMHDDCRHYLSQAYLLYRYQDNRAGALLACATLLTYCYLKRTTLSEIDQWIDELDQLVQENDGQLQAEVEAEVIAAAQVILFRRPSYPRLAGWAQRALALLARDNDVDRTVRLATFALHYLIWVGEFAPIGTLLATVERLSKNETDSISQLTQANWNAFGSLYFWIIGNYRDARELVNVTLRLGGEDHVNVLDFSQWMNAGFAALGQSDFPEAEQCLLKMKPSLDRDNFGDHAAYHFLSAVTCLFKNSPEEGLEAASQCLVAAERADDLYFVNLARLTLGQICTQQNRASEGIVHLRNALAFSKQMNSLWLECQANLMLARALLKIENTLEALGHLRRGLAIGREKCYVNLHPWWPPKLLTQLCAYALIQEIELGYLTTLIRTQGLDCEPAVAHVWPWPIRIITLGEFAVFVNDECVSGGRKTPKKELAILKIAIAAGQKGVKLNRLKEALWPESESTGRNNSFKQTLHRLRDLLQYPGVVEVDADNLTLNLNKIWVDFWALEELLDVPTQSIRADGRPVPSIPSVLNHYQGPFLRDDSVLPFVISAQERLRGRLTDYLLPAAEKLEASGNHEDAWLIYVKATEVDPLIEAFSIGAMRCALKLDKIGEGVAIYERMCEALPGDWRRGPSSSARTLFGELKKAGDR